MSYINNSVLLIGEPAVGKTHYGAQLLGRLMQGDGELRMNGQAENLEPFENALSCLNEGRAADHTAMGTYLESVWPIADKVGNTSELVWPDYGGEQIKQMCATRKIPMMWRDRILGASAWLLLIRLQSTHTNDDIFSRPFPASSANHATDKKFVISDQARLTELMQMLLYVGSSLSTKKLGNPKLCVLLSCWDELGSNETPAAVLQQRLPLFSSYLNSTWSDYKVLGLSALERSLRPDGRDPEYAENGPDKFGYVMLADGEKTADLTYPIKYLITK